MVPILACAVTVVVLKRRPAARVGVSRLDYQYDYCIAGALLMMVTGVVPGAAFVARSSDAHIEAYLKHRQLSVVQALNARPSLGAEPGRVATAKPAEAGSTTRHLTGWHGSFLYQTTLCREAGDVQPPPADGERPGRRRCRRTAGDLSGSGRATRGSPSAQTTSARHRLLTATDGETPGTLPAVPLGDVGPDPRAGAGQGRRRFVDQRSEGPADGPPGTTGTRRAD